jgi:hypothetical protein
VQPVPAATCSPYKISARLIDVLPSEHWYCYLTAQRLSLRNVRPEAA